MVLLWLPILGFYKFKSAFTVLGTTSYNTSRGQTVYLIQELNNFIGYAEQNRGHFAQQTLPKFIMAFLYYLRNMGKVFTQDELNSLNIVITGIQWRGDHFETIDVKISDIAPLLSGAAMLIATMEGKCAYKALPVVHDDTFIITGGDHILLWSWDRKFTPQEIPALMNDAKVRLKDTPLPGLV